MHTGGDGIGRRRSMRIAGIVLASLMPLQACTAGGDGFNASGLFSNTRAPARIAVTSERVTVRGPDGYCIDRSATTDGGDTAFVLVGSCASITGSSRAASPDQQALLTAAVSVNGEDQASVSQAISALGPFFSSSDGRAALSRSGDASTVSVQDVATASNMFIMQVEDASSNTLRGVEDTYWRALFDVDGAIVTVSVYSFLNRPLSAEAARQTLLEFAALIQGDNGAPSPARPPLPFAKPPQRPSPDGERRLAGGPRITLVERMYL